MRKIKVGIVRGLAWTSVGGDTLQIEVNVMPGKGTMQMTGQMGDVMKESAQTALSYIRSICPEYGVADDYFENTISTSIFRREQFRRTAVAGITMATAMLSAVTGRKVECEAGHDRRDHTARKGASDRRLKGRRSWLPGMAHMKRVLVPDKNRPDIAELSKEITKGLTIIFVKDMAETCLKEALVSE